MWVFYFCFPTLIWKLQFDQCCTSEICSLFSIPKMDILSNPSELLLTLATKISPSLIFLAVVLSLPLLSFFCSCPSPLWPVNGKNLGNPTLAVCFILHLSALLIILPWKPGVELLCLTRAASSTLSKTHSQDLLSINCFLRAFFWPAVYEHTVNSDLCCRSVGSTEDLVMRNEPWEYLQNLV